MAAKQRSAAAPEPISQLPVPPLFRMIQEAAGTDWREMYQVFNMGQRLEVFTDQATAEKLLELSATFHIDARISGKVDAAAKNSLLIESEFGSFEY